VRLLVIGFANSVHVARFLQLLDGTGWEIHLFDSQLATKPHPELPPVVLHAANACEAPEGVEVVLPDDAAQGPDWNRRVAQLGATLRELAPDVIHSHEIQHGGALVDAVRRGGQQVDAPWLVTNWGSDILWYGRDASYAPRIRAVMEGCDWFCAECHRDVALARAFGFRGRVVGVWPVAGGVDLAHAERLRAPGPPSARRAIALKGAVSANGQGQLALEAITRNADLLDGWELCGYQMNHELAERAAAFAAAAGMRYTQLSGEDSRQSTHDELLAMHGRARVHVGLNRTDALSTSFLEAIAMGAFPVQSSSSCGGEITPPGRGALFVPARDVDAVTAAVRTALTDDALVDAADPINARAVAEHLDRRRIRARIVDAYERIYLDRHWSAAA
jgi:hypothetical protein